MKIGPNYNAQVDKRIDRILGLVTIGMSIIATIMFVAATYFGLVGEINRAIEIGIKAFFILILSFGIYKSSR
jgi:hypothetical protein